MLGTGGKAACLLGGASFWGVDPASGARRRSSLTGGEGHERASGRPVTTGGIADQES